MWVHGCGEATAKVAAVGLEEEAWTDFGGRADVIFAVWHAIVKSKAEEKGARWLGLRCPREGQMGSPALQCDDVDKLYIGKNSGNIACSKSDLSHLSPRCASS